MFAMEKDEVISFGKWFRNTLIGFCIENFFLSMLYSAFGESAKYYQFPIAILLGAGIGYMQLRTLRSLYNLNMNWMLMYMFGLFVPFILLDLAEHKFNWWFPFDIINTIKMGGGGLCVGIAHARILKNIGYKSSVVYAVANAVSWLGIAVFANVNNHVQSSISYDFGLFLNLISVCFMGIVLSGVSALAMRYIQDQTLSESLKESEIEEQMYY